MATGAHAIPPGSAGKQGRGLRSTGGVSDESAWRLYDEKRGKTGSLSESEISMTSCEPKGRGKSKIEPSTVRYEASLYRKSRGDKSRNIGMVLIYLYDYAGDVPVEEGTFVARALAR